MNRFLKTLCLILAVGWTPMTQHCRLEIVGATLLSCQHIVSGGSEGCFADGCSTIEDGEYKLAAADIVAPAPVLIEPLYAALVVPPLLSNVGAGDSAPAFPVYAHPEDWVSTWQFVRRAAPPSRAPSRSLA